MPAARSLLCTLQNPYTAINAGQGGFHKAPDFRPATLFRLGQEARRTWLVAPQLSLSVGECTPCFIAWLLAGDRGPFRHP